MYCEKDVSLPSVAKDFETSASISRRQGGIVFLWCQSASCAVTGHTHPLAVNWGTSKFMVMGGRTCEGDQIWEGNPLWEEAMNMCVWSQAKASSNQYESYYPAWTSLSTTSLTGLNVACLTIIDTLHYFCSCVKTSWIGFYPFLGFALIVVESEECTERRQGVERPMQFVDSLLVNAFRELDQTYNICWISQHLLQGEISAHLVLIGGGMYWAFHWEYIYIYNIHIYTHSFTVYIIIS